MDVVGGWSEFQFAERRMPTLDEINATALETPVFILHLYCRALLNQAALRAGGLRTSPFKILNLFDDLRWRLTLVGLTGSKIRYASNFTRSLKNAQPSASP